MNLMYESVPPRPSDFAEFGKPYEGYWAERDKDPVDCCLPGAFLSGNFQTAQLDMCPDFMSQRCARSWDGKCDLYYQSLGDINDVRDFLSKSLDKKFCHLAANSKCTIQCQPFDPIAQTTAKVCTYLGTEPVKDRADELDIGYYLPVNMSPDYMGPCYQTCDVIAPDQIDPNDPLINKVMDIGYRSKVLTELCRISLETKTPISNPRLQMYCDQLVKEASPIVKSQKEGFQPTAPMKASSTSGSVNYTGIAMSVTILLLLILVGIRMLA